MRTPALVLGALAALALSAAPSAAQGRWTAAYPAVQDPAHVLIREMFLRDDVLASMVEPLNEHFPVPRDVTVEMAECGRPGAFYRAGRPAVQICYELITEMAETIMAGDREGGEEVFAGAFSIILLHQVGHAMVDQLGLPVSVPAEEAADQLAAVMVGYSGGELDTAVEGALVLNELEMDWENPGSGKTALSGRRLETLLCLLYGTDPSAHAWVVKEGVLPTKRAGACPARYEEVAQEWVEMLTPHVRG